MQDIFHPMISPALRILILIALLCNHSHFLHLALILLPIVIGLIVLHLMLVLLHSETRQLVLLKLNSAHSHDVFLHILIINILVVLLMLSTSLQFPSVHHSSTLANAQNLVVEELIYISFFISLM